MSYLYDVINKTPDIMPIKYRLVLRRDMTKGAAAGSTSCTAPSTSPPAPAISRSCATRSPTAAPPPGAGGAASSTSSSNTSERETESHWAIWPLPSRDRQQGHQAGVRLQRLPYQTSRIVFRPRRDAPKTSPASPSTDAPAGRRRQRIPRRNLTQGSPP